jgi:hypothetical protein
MITNTYVAEHVVRYIQRDRQAAAAARHLVREVRAAHRQVRPGRGASRSVAATSVQSRWRWFSLFTGAASAAR